MSTHCAQSPNVTAYHVAPSNAKVRRQVTAPSAHLGRHPRMPPRITPSQTPASANAMKAPPVAASSNSVSAHRNPDSSGGLIARAHAECSPRRRSTRAITPDNVGRAAVRTSELRSHRYDAAWRLVAAGVASPVSPRPHVPSRRSTYTPTVSVDVLGAACDRHALLAVPQILIIRGQMMYPSLWPPIVHDPQDVSWLHPSVSPSGR